MNKISVFVIQTTEDKVLVEYYEGSCLHRKEISRNWFNTSIKGEYKVDQLLLAYGLEIFVDLTLLGAFVNDYQLRALECAFRNARLFTRDDYKENHDTIRRILGKLKIKNLDPGIVVNCVLNV